MTFCVLGENCSVYDRHSECPGVSLYNPLCEGCRNRAVSELNLLRYDYVDLSQLMPKKDGHSEAKIARPKPESAPPIDMAVFTLRGEIAYECHMAERLLREHRGSRPRADIPVREGFSLDSAIRYLQPHVDDLALMPATVTYSGIEFLRLFGELHRRARLVCGLDARTITVPGLCPSCGVPSLRRHDDDPAQVWCVHCRMRMSKDDYYAAQRMQFAPSPEGP